MKEKNEVDVNADEAAGGGEKTKSAGKSKKSTHEVLHQFRNKTDQKIYNPGDDLSEIPEARLIELEAAGVIKKA